MNHWQQWMPGFHRIFYGHRILLVPVNLTDLSRCRLTVIHCDLMMISCNNFSSLRKFNGNFPLFNENFIIDPWFIKLVYMSISQYHFGQERHIECLIAIYNYNPWAKGTLQLLQSYSYSNVVIYISYNHKRGVCIIPTTSLCLTKGNNLFIRYNLSDVNTGFHIDPVANKVIEHFYYFKIFR